MEPQENDDVIDDLFELPTKRGHFRSTSEQSRKASKRDDDGIDNSSSSNSVKSIRKQSSAASLNGISSLFSKICLEPKDSIVDSEKVVSIFDLSNRTKSPCTLNTSHFTCEKLIGKGNIGFVFRVAEKAIKDSKFAIKMVPKVALQAKNKVKEDLIAC